MSYPQELERLRPTVLMAAVAIMAKGSDLHPEGEILRPSQASRNWRRSEVKAAVGLAWELAQSVIDQQPEGKPQPIGVSGKPTH